MEFYSPNDYKNRQHKGRSSKKLAVFGLVLVVACAATAGYLTVKNIKPTIPVEKTVDVLVVEDKKVSYTQIEGRYLFNGTIVMARAVEKYARGDYKQPFSQLSTFSPEQYDAQSADFECPITNNVVPYELQVSNLVFNCRPEWLPEMTKYITIYDLANNHTDNQGGQTGLTETRQHLQKYNVQYFGNFDPTVTQDICEILGLPVRLQKQDKTEEKAIIPIAFCGWHYFNYNRGPTQVELDAVKQYSDIMPVFAFVEMGAEYQAKAGEVQRSIAHQIIEAGANFVFANNPHWVQDSEVYKGKLIVYSLGNFIFDQIDAETQRGVSIDVTLTVPYSDMLAKWLAMGGDCVGYKDSCLTKAQEQHLTKLAVKLVYAPIANQNGAQKITHKASEAVQKAVEERLNWDAVSKQLGQ